MSSNSSLSFRAKRRIPNEVLRLCHPLSMTKLLRIYEHNSSLRTLFTGLFENLFKKLLQFLPGLPVGLLVVGKREIEFLS
jgi:hypothetical protein